MKKLILFVALSTCVVGAGSAVAATATGTFTTTATVAAAGTCTAFGGGALFGTITPPISAAIDLVNFGLAVQCPVGTAYSIALSAGGSGNADQRRMYETTDPTHQMDYNIYTNAQFATVWGDGSGTTAIVTGTGDGTNQNFVPGVRVPAQVTPFAGSYADTVTVTVSY